MRILPRTATQALVQAQQLGMAVSVLRRLQLRRLSAVFPMALKAFARNENHSLVSQPMMINSEFTARVQCRVTYKSCIAISSASAGCMVGEFGGAVGCIAGKVAAAGLDGKQMGLLSTL